MSFIGSRYAKSEYHYLNIEYKQRTNHIRSIVANNFYGSMMLFQMPVGNYKLENNQFVQKFRKNIKFKNNKV